MRFNLSKLMLVFSLSLILQTAQNICTAKDTNNAKDVKSAQKQTAKDPVVVIKTNKGEIEVKLNSEKAPITVENFIKYVNEKFYDGTIFHRIIPTFMIQGGGFLPDMTEKKTHDAIKNEAGNGLSNKRGTIAMARTNVVDSATAQFFINVVDNPMLDHRSEDMNGFGYAVFGEVIKGMDVVDKIKTVKTGSKGIYDDVPQESVVIKSIRIKK